MLRTAWMLILIPCLLAEASLLEAQSRIPPGRGQPRTGQQAAPRGQQQQQQPRQSVPLPQGRSRFQLTQQQKNDLWAALVAWQNRSSQIETFSCTFKLLHYDAVFDDSANSTPQGSGELKFKKPDKILYKVNRPTGRQPGGKWAFRTEHILCDGKSVFRYDYEQKRLIEQKIPPEFQGRALSDGPLPFLFGANANKLMQRYDMRIVTPPAKAKEEVWLEAYPWTREDAVEFQRATIIMKITDMLPNAVELYAPNGNREVYVMDDVAVNQKALFPLFRGDDFEAQVPRGWTRFVEPTARVPGPAAPTPRGQAQVPGRAPAPR